MQEAAEGREIVAQAPQFPRAGDARRAGTAAPEAGRSVQAACGRGPKGEACDDETADHIGSTMQADGEIQNSGRPPLHPTTAARSLRWPSQPSRPRKAPRAIGRARGTRPPAGGAEIGLGPGTARDPLDSPFPFFLAV